MRTIVALLLAATASAQTAADLDRIQKNIADHPDNFTLRTALLQTLLDRNVILPVEKVRAMRREHIFWLIEHHPEAKVFDQAGVVLSPRGRLADAAASAEAVRLWKETIEKPGAKPVVIANAAIYLRVIDVPEAQAILADRAADPEISRARGFVDASTIFGLSGIGQNANFASLASLRESREAKAALAEIKSSSDPNLLGGAGVALRRFQGYEIPFDLTFGDDDPPALAEHLLRRAIELDPQTAEWKTELGQTLVIRSNRTLDPKEKARLLSEALSMIPENQKQNMLPNLALAEFDAGDDEAAGRDAKTLADRTRNGNQYHIAQTVLGRIAAANGDLEEAKRRLIASVTMPSSIRNAVFQPNFTLAQDVYDSGDKDTVLRFLEASREVWKFDRGRIDRTISFVKKAPSVDLVEISRQSPGGEILRHPAPAFEAMDGQGNSWSREQLAGKVAILEFGSAPLAEKIAKDYVSRGAVLLQVKDDDTKRRFEVLTNPTVIVIDKQGNVSAYHPGASNEAEWRNDFESGFGRGPNSVSLPAPKQVEPAPGARGKATLSWEPVDGAESYVVEWDTRDEIGWVFDRERTVRVIPTREQSATLEVKGLSRIRWRVYAVPRNGPAGAVSPWQELDGTTFTKIYR